MLYLAYLPIFFLLGLVIFLIAYQIYTNVLHLLKLSQAGSKDYLKKKLTTLFALSPIIIPFLNLPRPNIITKFTCIILPIQVLIDPGLSKASSP